MFGLENLGLLGLFIGSVLAATVVPFSSDALYVAVLAAIGDPAACLVVGTRGNSEYKADNVRTFYTGFAHIGKMYFDRTGKSLLFYPLFSDRTTRSFRIGSPVA